MADHVQTCYGGRVGKSMEGVELSAIAQSGSNDRRPADLATVHRLRKLRQLETHGIAETAETAEHD